MERTIRMKGKATVKAPSDITVVSLKISGVRKDFKSAVKAMADTVTLLKGAIESAGIPRDSLKTSSLSVRQNYTKEKIGEDRYGNDQYKEIPDGFAYYQDVIFEFKNDNQKLSASIGNILNLKVTPRIEFSFKSSDMEAMKNKALVEACRHAHEEASMIVESVGSKLGKLVSVERNFSSRAIYDDEDEECTLSASFCAGPSMPVIDVDPLDVSVEQSVEMVWEIEG